MLPKDLIDKYLNWKENSFSKDKMHFEKLAKEGQSPEYIIISCVDSRVDPNAIFQTKAGEMLVHRNIANLVPPYEYLTKHSGTIAAIEFGITALNIKNIIILGHSGCGGIKNGYHLCNKSSFDRNSAISNWLNLLKPAYDKLPSGNDDDLVNSLEKLSIIQSIENLKSYPFIDKSLNKEKISIFGIWHDLGLGTILSYNHNEKKFEEV